MKGRYYLALFLCFFLSFQTSIASSRDTLDDLYQLSLEELLKINITSSTLQDESLQSVPSSISVYHREEIKRLGFTRLTELMNYVPGFQAYRVDSGWPRYNHSVRGRRIGDATPEILILIDGVRINNDWRGSGTGYNLYISLDNIESAEFIRGPGSSIYGSNAFLGVISLTTSGRREINVAASPYGDDQRLHWVWQEGSRELTFFANRKNYNGQKYSIFDPDLSVQAFVDTSDPFTAENIYMTAEVDGFSAHFSYNKTTAEDFYLGGFVSNEQNRSLYQTMRLDVNQTLPLLEQLDMDFQLYVVDRGLSVTSILSQSNDIGATGSVDEKEWGVVARMYYQPLERARTVFGVEYREPDMNNLRSRFFGSVESEFLIGRESKRRINAFFAQFQYEINEQWQYLMGLRRDDYSNFGSHNSPRLSLLYHADSNNTLKLLYSEAFRAPTREENDTINNPTAVGNSMLHPETAATLELVWSHLFNTGFFQMTIFDVLIRDSIIEDDSPEPQKQINGNDQTIGGVEIEWKLRPTSQIEYRMAFTHFLNEAKINNTEANILLSNSLSYFLNDWTFSIRGFYQNEKYHTVDTSLVSSGFVEQESKLEVDININYQITKNFESYLKVKNIFNENVNSPVERSTNIVGSPTESRLAEVGLRFSF